MTHAIVMGGSRGIGRAIAGALREMGADVVAASSTDVDTSDRSSVEAFAARHPETDVLVLNTGGPEPKTFAQTTPEDWDRCHDLLFTGFCSMLRRVRIRDGGYVFLISSMVVREPTPNLVLSAAYRAAFSEVFKVVSKEYAGREITCVNIAPGPFDTDRTRQLVKDVKELAGSLPMGRLGRPEEIGSFVAGIVKDRTKYISGIIDFDGASSARSI
ncbi:MAG: SDR family oxidoreductase [Nitrosopumilus sp.]|nr:SDR family oxidoreductase [Nitrosopumilus sp.]MDA7943088.1 SDR family oxidoreductase [Nitrosopumilus sp.]